MAALSDYGATWQLSADRGPDDTVGLGSDESVNGTTSSGRTGVDGVVMSCLQTSEVDWNETYQPYPGQIKQIGSLEFAVKVTNHLLCVYTKF